jgi:hypothetical protein
MSQLKDEIKLRRRAQKEEEASMYKEKCGRILVP